MPESSPGAPSRSPEPRIFDAYVGTWDAEIEVQTPTGPERLSGTRVARLVGGGLWLVTDLTVGSGFEGHGVFGWDPSKRKYVGTWIDSMRTFLAPMEGSYDAVTRTLTMHGEATLPSGKLQWRELYSEVDPDTQRFQNFVRSGAGEEQLGITATYRRRRES